MDFSLIIGILALVATIVGTALGYRFGRRSEFGVFEWMRELRAWTSQVLEILTKAHYGVRNGSASDADRKAWVNELSTHIEVGRFYLPNQQRDDWGIEKPAAYRGYRHAALDPLVASIRVIESGETKEEQVLWELRREFVSAIFAILGPDHHNREVARIIRESHDSRKGDLTAGGLLQDHTIPQGAAAVLVRVRARIESARDKSSEV